MLAGEGSTGVEGEYGRIPDIPGSRRDLTQLGLRVSTGKGKEQKSEVVRSEDEMDEETGSRVSSARQGGDPPCSR